MKKLNRNTDVYSLKILMLKGEWVNDEFIKGEIKYTYLDGEDHIVYLDNNRFKKKKLIENNQIKQEPEITRNIGSSSSNNSSNSSSSGSKRSFENVQIKQENKKLKKYGFFINAINKN
jgi:hypothetical protein